MTNAVAWPLAPGDAQPTQRSEDVIDVCGPDPLGIQIVDAQTDAGPDAARYFLRDEEVDGIARMEIAAGCRGEAGDGHPGNVS